MLTLKTVMTQAHWALVLLLGAPGPSSHSTSTGMFSEPVLGQSSRVILPGVESQWPVGCAELTRADPKTTPNLATGLAGSFSLESLQGTLDASLHLLTFPARAFFPNGLHIYLRNK